MFRSPALRETIDRACVQADHLASAPIRVQRLGLLGLFIVLTVFTSDFDGDDQSAQKYIPEEEASGGQDSHVSRPGLGFLPPESQARLRRGGRPPDPCPCHRWLRTVSE